MAPRQYSTGLLIQCNATTLIGLSSSEGFVISSSVGHSKSYGISFFYTLFFPICFSDLTFSSESMLNLFGFTMIWVRLATNRSLSSSIGLMSLEPLFFIGVMPFSFFSDLLVPCNSLRIF